MTGLNRAALIRKLRKAVDPSHWPAIAARLRPEPEPPLEPAFREWRAFYANRVAHYAEILAELGEHNDEYSRWYKAGGYGYDPKESRRWVMRDTSIPDYRGTCLDIGSGDGFWTWILSEWFSVTGIDPVQGGVDLAEAIRRRLPRPIQNRTRFVVGDALDVTERYDVVFCRAPSFFNYPIYKPFDTSMLDLDRKRIMEVWRKSDPTTAEARLAAYPAAPTGFADKPLYAGNWRQYLEAMLGITDKLFVFILSTHPDYYGLYMGDTYNHDPAEVERLFAEFGRSRVRMDSTNTYIVGEIYR